MSNKTTEQPFLENKVMNMTWPRMVAEKLTRKEADLLLLVGVGCDLQGQVIAVTDTELHVCGCVTLERTDAIPIVHIDASDEPPTHMLTLDKSQKNIIDDKEKHWQVVWWTSQHATVVPI